MKTQENEVVLVEFSPIAKVSKTITTRINEGNVNLQGQKLRNIHLMPQTQTSRLLTCCHMK